MIFDQILSEKNCIPIEPDDVGVPSKDLFSMEVYKKVVEDLAAMALPKNAPALMKTTLAQR